MNSLAKIESTKIKSTYLFFGFIVDVVEENDNLNFWLRHENYGYAIHMFGVDEKTMLLTQGSEENIIYNNLSDYIDEYIEQLSYDDLENPFAKCLDD